MAEKKNEKQDLTCKCCEENMSNDHVGIVCTNGCNICPTCSPALVSSIFDDPESKIPVTCPYCKADIVASSFERQLTEEQRSLYLTFCAMKSINAGEKLVYCSFCTNFEIWPDRNSGMDLFYCHSSKCSKVSCVHCNLEVDVEVDGYDDDDFHQERKVSDTDVKNFFYHNICAALAPYKATLDKALSLGTGVSCPSCGLLGRKDDACTHIRCTKCRTMYCYICCQSEEVCDKEGGSAGGIYQHNIDWDINTLRCPMYLTEIHEVDNSWPEDDNECVEKISKHKTLFLLRQVLTEMEEKNFDLVYAKYGAGVGFSKDEILNADLSPLIKRMEIVEE